MSGESSMINAQGRFLTIEGIEGVGKTTQIMRLSKILSDRGIAHVVTREPGGTPLAEKIRDLVLGSREPLPDTAELLLMFAARAVHLQNLIEPNLAAGRWVLCDRFTDATYAYQGAGRGLGDDQILPLELLVQRARRPDLTLLLDLPVAVGLQRARRRNQDTGIEHADQDRFELQRAEFFERVRAAYLVRAAAEPGRVSVIDAGRSADEVTSQIVDVLGARTWIS
jgi:dTMP kinase